MAKCSLEDAIIEPDKTAINPTNIRVFLLKLAEFIVKKRRLYDHANNGENSIITIDVNAKKIIDPFNGIDDLKNKRLKIINIDTFVEDPLRVLRAMGFCARFELICDNNLITTCQSMIKNNMLDELPTSRIYTEFIKLFLKSTKPSIGLEFLKRVDGLDFFNELNMDKELWINTLKSIDKFSITFISIIFRFNTRNNSNKF